MTFTTVSIILIIAVAHFPLLILATSLISQYVLYEAGPGGALRRFRFWAGVNVPRLASPVFVNDFEIDNYNEAVAAGVSEEYLDIAYDSDGTFLGDVLSCYKCFAPYAATVALVTAVFPPLFYILAAAGGNIVLTRWFLLKESTESGVREGAPHDGV